MTKIAKDILEGWEIVIIDDEPHNAEVANIILVAYGATVYIANHGEQGLRLVKHRQPHFVICDLSMPVMDGWAFIKVMKADDELSEIPVIALTAHAMLGDHERALQAGFFNYLTKPLTVKTFIRDLLDRLIDHPQLAERLKQ